MIQIIELLGVGERFRISSMSLAEVAPKTKEQEQVRRMGRRTFLKWGITAAAGALVTGGAGLYTPEKPPASQKLEKQTDKEVFPGWIESKVKSPFIRLDKGHFYWLREAVFNNSLLLDSTRDFFSYLNENLQAGHRLGLGKMLSQAIAISKKRLNAIESSNFDPLANHDLEAIHAGAVTFAASLNPWFSAGDLRKFGVPLRDSPYPVPEYFWGKNGLGARVLPGLFGVENGFSEDEVTEYSEPSQTGQDRTVHFAQHLLITFAYLYSRHYNLGEHQSIPSILRVPIAFRGENSPIKEAQVFSNWAGRLYEFSALFRPESLPVPGIRKRSEIPDGPFDLMVEADYKGNRLGALTAIALWTRVLRGESINAVLRELDDPRFSRFETEPRLNSL